MIVDPPIPEQDLAWDADKVSDPVDKRMGLADFDLLLGHLDQFGSDVLLFYFDRYGPQHLAAGREDQNAGQNESGVETRRKHSRVPWKDVNRGRREWSRLIERQPTLISYAIQGMVRKCVHRLVVWGHSPNLG